MNEDSKRIEQCLPLIAAWYAATRRELPWRKEPEPYHVWLSEIMLQQTRIEAVIPYYQRFLAAIPTVAVLARVQEDRLLKLWEGLGYYSRARNLKKAAELIMERWGGELPSSVKELKTLPGIGDYTAGAIASIAYGQPEPAVDGNVLRVMARILAMEEDVQSAAVKKRMTVLLRQYYPAGKDAALVTEGLMELGETVCIPNGEARCSQCPVFEYCLARQTGRMDQLPVRSAQKERKVQKHTVLLLCRNGAYAVRKRPSQGLLAGLWEFPNREGWLSPGELETCMAELGLGIRSSCSSVAHKHVFTHVEWHMRSYLVECTGENDLFLWKKPDEIRRECSIPTAFRLFQKVIEERDAREREGHATVSSTDP